VSVYDRPFAVTIGELRKGELANELTEQLAKVVAGVMTVGKPGKLTLTLSVKLAAKRSDMVVIEDAVTVKDPQPDRPPTLFFATDGGGLSRKDPSQVELPFRQVATEES
jgi:hypothetical protein